MRKSTSRLAILSWAAALGVALIPLACSNEEGEDVTSQTHTASLTINREAKTFRMVQESRDCSVNPPTLGLDTLEMHYAIANGKLTYWSHGECTAMVLQGSSQDLVGDWKTTDLVASTVPAPGAPASCLGEVPAADDFPPYENWGIDVHITETALTAKYQGNYCAARVMATSLLGLGEAGSGRFNITSNQCRSIEGTRKTDNKPVSITSSSSGQTITTQVTFNGKTCTQKMQDPTNAPCGDTTSQEEFMAFYRCLSEAGLISDGLDKRAGF